MASGRTHRSSWRMQVLVIHLALDRCRHSSHTDEISRCDVIRDTIQLYIGQRRSAGCLLAIGGIVRPPCRARISCDSRVDKIHMCCLCDEIKFYIFVRLISVTRNIFSVINVDNTNHSKYLKCHTFYFASLCDEDSKQFEKCNGTLKPLVVLLEFPIN